MARLGDGEPVEDAKVVWDSLIHRLQPHKRLIAGSDAFSIMTPIVQHDIIAKIYPYK